MGAKNKNKKNALPAVTCLTFTQGHIQGHTQNKFCTGKLAAIAEEGAEELRDYSALCMYVTPH